MNQWSFLKLLTSEPGFFFNSIYVVEAIHKNIAAVNVPV